jgi:hypothetical protein
MGRFTAAIQYDDWKGTVAADNTDLDTNIHSYLKSAGLITDQEFLVGLELSVFARHGDDKHHPYVSAFVVDGVSFDDVARKLQQTAEPVPMRIIALKLSLPQFFDLFKGFHLMISKKGLGLDGREYREIKTN